MLTDKTNSSSKSLRDCFEKCLRVQDILSNGTSDVVAIMTVKNTDIKSFIMSVIFSLAVSQLSLIRSWKE